MCSVVQELYWRLQDFHGCHWLILSFEPETFTFSLNIINVMCTYRVPTPPGKSWIFFPKISRTWKVLENEFGPGKYWKLKFKFLESPGIYLRFNLINMSFMYKCKKNFHFITTCKSHVIHHTYKTAKI